MTRIEKERHSLILELKISLRTVWFEKNKSLNVYKTDLKRRLLGANPVFLGLGPSVAIMNGSP